MSQTYHIAIRRSFAADERDPLPPREQCYLAESSFNALKDLGLPIEETDIFNEDDSCSGDKNKSILLLQFRFRLEVLVTMQR